MSKFLDSSYPVITAMVGHEHIEDMIAEMDLCLNQGAEALGVTMHELVAEEKTKENIKRIIDAAKGRQIYITNYIRGNSQPELTDDTLAEQLLEMAECGANLIDVRTDMFCRQPDEVTTDAVAVEKQKRFIDQVHKTGAEVLMSTHIFEYKSPEEILKIAEYQQKRGADIAKIVTFVNDEREVDDAFRTNYLLKEKLKIPFLFLVNGECCKRHRLLGPVLGSCMYLCVENSKNTVTQPTISEAKNIIEAIRITEENYVHEK